MTDKTARSIVQRAAFYKNVRFDYGNVRADMSKQPCSCDKIKEAFKRNV